MLVSGYYPHLQTLAAKQSIKSKWLVTIWNLVEPLKHSYIWHKVGLNLLRVHFVVNKNEDITVVLVTCSLL